MKALRFFFLLTISIFFFQDAKSQLIFDTNKGCNIDSNGDCIPNAVLSAVPFLRITPDARSGALGDAGIAISPTSDAIHFNASNLAFTENDLGVSTTFAPWLNNRNLSDAYLAYLSGYKKIDDVSTLGASFRFFSLGEINFTNGQGIITGTGRPIEFELATAYARKLSRSFSVAVTAKFVRSNLALNQQTFAGEIIQAANAIATDISVTYHTELDITSYGSNLRVGAAITNLGNKVSYTRNGVSDFLPGNLGIGAALDLEFDDFNMLTFALDFNKLLVPTPLPTQIIEDGVVTDIPVSGEQNLIQGVFGSFGDAPGGFSEELSEVNLSTGLEYWYNSKYAIRAGYFYENPLKGARQYLTVGLGLRYKVYGFDLAYSVPTNDQKERLDNTLRFTLKLEIE